MLYSHWNHEELEDKQHLAGTSKAHSLAGMGSCSIPGAHQDPGQLSALPLRTGLVEEASKQQVQTSSHLPFQLVSGSEDNQP